MWELEEEIGWMVWLDFMERCWDKVVVCIFFLCFLIGCSSKLSKEEVGRVSSKELDKELVGDRQGEKSSRRPNHLIKEKSPYLLQHAYNPVDWYPWGKEAFERARREDRPIFLSIGYSTCHWCHVMEKESFEDEEVARLLNETFVCIKVDREERPDIDHVYMEVCQMLTGSGGWPLTIMMTPEKKPFFAATYIPKRGRYGRMGMLELIPRIKRLWREDRKALLASADRIVAALQRGGDGVSGGGELKADVLDRAFKRLRERFDRKNGGFGTAPKFPTPHNLIFLLRYWRRTGDGEALEMVEKTLRRMRLGGIFDQLGYGFHRYSTDERWFLPHFEKMLYDQAMLMMAYTEAYQATGKGFYRRVVEELFEYVKREMRDSGGGFYSAEDADSEGEEGKFYLWTKGEILKVLGREDGELFSRVYGVEDGGNFEEEATGRRTGRNILHLSRELSEEARLRKRSLEEFRESLDRMRRKLLEVRAKRVRPLRDDKILADWNGLMVAALARAGGVLGERDYIEVAEKAVEFLMKRFHRGGRLLHRYRGGEVSILGYSSDYAFVIWGLLELYEVTGSWRYLRWAVELQGEFTRYFWDKKGGYFHVYGEDGERLLVRPKELYDGAIPSANSVAAWNLLRLGRILSKAEWEEMAARIGRAFSRQVERVPEAFCQYLVALDFALGPSYEVIVVGRGEELGVARRRLWGVYAPRKVLIFLDLEGISEVVKWVPYLKDYGLKNGRLTVYVCRNYSCSLPENDIQKVLERLKEK